MITEAILIAILTSPVILAVTQKLLNRKPGRIQLEKIEEINTSLNLYKIEQATLALSLKNWRIIERKKVSPYCMEEWLMLFGNLQKLQPQEQWSARLKRETDESLIIIRGDNNGQHGQ